MEHASFVKVRPGEFCYELRLQLHNFKVMHFIFLLSSLLTSYQQGFNQGKAGLQMFSLTSPELPQHILFDLPTLMLVYFFHRGVLPSKYHTWDDVLQSEDMEILVREQVSKEPLYGFFD